jgi:cytochrome b561
MKQIPLETYSLRSQWMHAIVAFLVLGLLTLGYFLNKLPGSWQNQAYMLHKSFGLIVLFLMLLRVCFILRDGRPLLSAKIKPWERYLARTVQFFLYLTLILMPLSGWIMSVADGYIPSLFNLFNLDLPFIPLDKSLGKLFAKFHYYLAWGIFTLVVMHLLGNAKHYFWDKDDLLARMWRFRH